jgi:hypothetical protein
MIKSHTDNPMDPFTINPQIDEEYIPTDEDWASFYDDDQELEMYSLECAFGPEE